MKKIYCNEYTYVCHRYDIEVVISESDFEKLENNEITIDDICSRYEVNYVGPSRPLFEDSKFDEYVYTGSFDEDYSSSTEN
jgi:hypothetical protein